MAPDASATMTASSALSTSVAKTSSRDAFDGVHDGFSSVVLTEAVTPSPVGCARSVCATNAGARPTIPSRYATAHAGPAVGDPSDARPAEANHGRGVGRARAGEPVEC